MADGSRTQTPLPPMTGEAEETLVLGMVASDRAALQLYFERTHHAVYSMARRLTRDPELRRDWTHDVLMGVLEDVQRGRFVWRHPGSFWAWFGKRAWFRLLDCGRRHRLRHARELSLEARGERLGADAPPAGAHEALLDPPLAQQLEWVEMTASVESCLEQLPNDQHRRALRLLLFDDLSYEAIAERMDSPLNTVRAWIRRGRLLLRLCVARALGMEVGAQEQP